jgi:hypothetical protein
MRFLSDADRTYIETWIRHIESEMRFGVNLGDYDIQKLERKIEILEKILRNDID